MSAELPVFPSWDAKSLNVLLLLADTIFEKQNIILLDEPTNALDNDGVQLIYSIIKEEKQRGATVIVATHHKEDLDELCDTILTVSEGRLIE